MDASMWVAKTGLTAQSTRMTVIANNLANVNTIGFKKDRANFEDLLYQRIVQAGAQADQIAETPTGLMLGTGTRVVSTEKLHRQGNMISTENSLDVAISGDGGDELFYGYDRTSKSINGIKLPDKLTKMIYKFYPYFFGSGGNILSRSKNLKTSYKSYLSDFKLKNYLFKNKKGHFDLEVTLLDTNSYLKSCLLSDYKFFLPEMMLLKIDRTSMKNSLEVRSPYVDHRLIEYMLSTNISDYLGLSRKKFLKEILIKDFDKSFVNRKKMGFVFDVENWIYDNPEVERTVNNGEIAKKKTNVYKKLSRVKTIFNAQRLWKIYTLEKYLKSIEEIIIR